MVFLLIRPVNEYDAQQLAPLMLEYIVDFYKRPNPGEAAVRQHILYLLGHPGEGVQFVAEEDGQLVGFATLYFTFSTTSPSTNRYFERFICK